MSDSLSGNATTKSHADGKATSAPEHGTSGAFTSSACNKVGVPGTPNKVGVPGTPDKVGVPDAAGSAKVGVPGSAGYSNSGVGVPEAASDVSSQAPRTIPGSVGGFNTVPQLRNAARPPRPSAFSNALVFGWRAALKFKHVPEQMFDLVMTPIMFTLLFTFVFGGALAGTTGDYLQFFLPGILVQTVVFNAVYSGMGLSTDLSKGLFDRFRSLPIWSLAPFAGLMVGDILRHLIAATIILTIGLLLGYRPEAGVGGVAAAFALLIGIGFGMGWIFIVLGLLISTPMTVMTFGFTFLFPLVFASNIMVDPATMPDWLRAFVDVNPVSLMTTAMRGLMGGGATASQVMLALAAPVVLTLVLAPVTLKLYRRQ